MKQGGTARVRNAPTAAVHRQFGMPESRRFSAGGRRAAPEGTSLPFSLVGQGIDHLQATGNLHAAQSLLGRTKIENTIATWVQMLRTP